MEEQREWRRKKGKKDDSEIEETEKIRWKKTSIILSEIKINKVEERCVRNAFNRLKMRRKEKTGKN